MKTIQLKRIYEAPDANDGYRVLVDRLWPRGIKKEKAALDLWLKEIAPSDDLRKWFNHDPNKWAEFEKKYQKELNNHEEATDQLLSICKKESKVTLLYGAKDEAHNQAVVIYHWLENKL